MTSLALLRLPPFAPSSLPQPSYLSASWSLPNDLRGTLAPGRPLSPLPALIPPFVPSCFLAIITLSLSLILSFAPSPSPSLPLPSPPPITPAFPTFLFLGLRDFIFDALLRALAPSRPVPPQLPSPLPITPQILPFCFLAFVTLSLMLSFAPLRRPVLSPSSSEPRSEDQSLRCARRDSSLVMPHCKCEKQKSVRARSVSASSVRARECVLEALG